MTAIYANGIGLATVAAAEKVAIYSESPVKLYQKVGYPNFPDSWDLVTTTTAGTEYTSAAFTNATDIRMEASAAVAYYETGASPSIFTPLADQSFADATGLISGLAAAQGGSATLKGGTSSTAGNAGGAAALLGGQPGATGVGGAATVTGGAGGATSGTGGAATVTAGAGTNGNAAGGVASMVGGAGQGTGAGGATSVTGGASGAGATGNGGATSLVGGAAASTDGDGGAASVTGGAGAGTGTGGAVTLTGGASGAGATGDGADIALVGGAAASTNGNGGSITLTPGAKAGTGIAGGIFKRSAGGQYFLQQTAATAKADGAQSITAAQMINGIVVHTITAASTLTTPTGAALAAGCPADLAAGDAFDFHYITVGAGADDIGTLTAGDGNITFVGDVTVGPGAAGTTSGATFRMRYSGANVWIGYRIG